MKKNYKKKKLPTLTRFSVKVAQVLMSESVVGQQTCNNKNRVANCFFKISSRFSNFYDVFKSAHFRVYF